MGVSTNAQICFGIKFDEGYEFPWYDEKYDSDPVGWWLDFLGYRAPFQVYDDNGAYIDGLEPDKNILRQYYHHRREFLDKNPLPFEVVNYCSCDYEMIIIAVKGSVMEARRGSPTILDLKSFKVTEIDVVNIARCCERYFPGNELGYKPEWWLSSLWC